jgi:hypothetical protein
LLRDKTKEFVTNSRCSVGIFVNRGFVRSNHILVIINTESDLHLLTYVNTLQKTTNGFVQLLNRIHPASPESVVVTDSLCDYLKTAKDTALTFENDLSTELLRNADLMLVSYNSWLLLSKEKNDILQGMPSTFIIQHR